MSNSSQTESDHLEISRWQENHGNFLLAVTAAIILFGSGVLACRQSQMLPKSLVRPPIVDPEQVLADQAAEAGDFGPRQTITVRVSGAGSDEGKMKLAVYISPHGFNDPDQALGTDSWIIRDGLCEGKFGLPEGITELAIAAFHDVNDNGILDRNAFGIPSERYGFTGNARGVTGPPTFEEALVPITEGPIDISIR
ncbi:MAG: DUF2141 domain-containing protein [Planctomycetaceae bacterium]|nr:MAG: DUF2141 domain-containing protein [Planctomycetaceae bacterium]